MNKFIVLGIIAISGLSGFFVARAQDEKTVGDRWQAASSELYLPTSRDEWLAAAPGSWSKDIQEKSKKFTTATKALVSDPDGSAIEQAAHSYFNSYSGSTMKQTDEGAISKMALIQVAQNQRLIEQNDEIIRLLKSKK